MKYSRPLRTNINVEVFLCDVLDCKKDEQMITDIVDAQAAMLNVHQFQMTIRSLDFRDGRYRSESERWKLRKRIVNELFTLKRLAIDDKIRLGKGGALPNSEVQCNKQAFILIGLPASGKSSIAVKISEEFGAIILDSDYAKRKFPEFRSSFKGAYLVHTESDSMIFSPRMEEPNDFETLLDKCLSIQANIIIPKIGSNTESVEMLAKMLKDDYNYDVHLTLIDLDRKKATVRAIERFRKSGRYVPLGLIFDHYSNDPTLNYYRFKRRCNELFTSFGEISTDVTYPEPGFCVECIDDNPSKLFMKSHG